MKVTMLAVIFCLVSLFVLPSCCTYITYGGATYIRLGEQSVEGFELETSVSDTTTTIEVKLQKQKSEMEALKEALKTLQSMPTEVLMSLIGG